MPPDFIGIITPEQFYFLSGMAGISAAFLIFIIWARGL